MDKDYQDVHIVVNNGFDKTLITDIREVKLVSIKTVKGGFLKITYTEKDTNVRHEVLVPQIESLAVTIN